MTHVAMNKDQSYRRMDLHVSSLCTGSPSDWVVVADCRCVVVIVGLEPLHELHIIQRPRFDQLVHLDWLQEQV